MRIEQLCKSTTEENEILNILDEECAEVIQAASKVFRFGWDSCDPSKPNYTNREHLTQELGDLLCMVMILCDKGVVDENEMYEAMSAKKDKLRKFSNIDLSYLD